MQTPAVTFKVTPHELEIIVAALKILDHVALRIGDASQPDKLEGLKLPSVGTMRKAGNEAHELLAKIGMR